MKVGTLIRFKHPDFRGMYGPGVLLEKNTSVRLDSRYWAFFKDERIMIRLEEVEPFHESR